MKETLRGSAALLGAAVCLGVLTASTGCAAVRDRKIDERLKANADLSVNPNQLRLRMRSLVD